MHYTRNEVGRMIGVTPRQLDYWSRLRLVRPRARWGERFFDFADLVALETIKQLTEKGLPARRLRRAIDSLDCQLDAAAGNRGTRLAQLRVVTDGRHVVVIPPGPSPRPFEPLTGQFILHFETGSLARKVHALSSRSAEEWFEIGLASDSNPETLEKAAEAYRRALELAPEWVEAHINLGTVLYQLGQMEEAKYLFSSAAELEPKHPLAHFNLGCVLEQLGDTPDAIRHLRTAVELAPNLADAHLNLALSYEKTGQNQLARRHLSLYLRYEPRGPWAEFARARIEQKPAADAPGKVTPFRRNS